MNDSGHNWMEYLEYDARGNILPTMANMEIIIKNDNNLSGFVFNEMKGCIDVVGSTPWTRTGKSFAQTDLANYQLYLEKHYYIYAPAKSKETLQAVLSSDRRYHPVKRYLENLTWDGTKCLKQLAFPGL